MNILYINHYAGGLKYGMEFRPYYLAEEWVQKGHKVRILAGDYSHLRQINPVVENDFDIDTIEGIEYQWIKSGKYSGNSIGRVASMLCFVGKMRLNAKKIANDFKPEIVISSSTYPLDVFPAKKIADYAGARYVHEIHDMWPITPMELYGMSKWNPFVMIMQLGENYFCRNADKVVSILPCAKNYLRKHGMTDSKFIHVPNGINLSDWNEMAAIPAEHKKIIINAKNEGRFIIGFFGSHTRSYNLDALLEAVSRCDQRKLFIVFLGNGNYKEHLMDLALSLQLDKKCYAFLAPVPKKAVSSFTQLIDVCYVGAVNNKMFKFGIGMNKLFDSMMSGKPLLYAVNAPNNLVKEYCCGVSVEPENIEALVNGINTFLSLTKDELETMGQNGKRAVLQVYNYKVLAKTFLDKIMSKPSTVLEKLPTETGLVSIVMPSWNTARFIAKSIESILNQTYKNWELIIVDDCSSDNTDDIIAKYTDPRIRYIKNETNSGAALTRNRALREAKGEWIAFLDSDDLWEPQKLERQLAYMLENDYVFSYHEYVKIDEEDKPLNIYVSGPEVVTEKDMYNYGYPGCLTFMYNANYFGLLQIKDIKKNNDYAMLLKLCKKADCYLLKENLAQYRIRKKSISHDKLRRKLRSHYDLFHICDEQNPLVSFWYSCWNMYYGLVKKRKYERKIR